MAEKVLIVDDEPDMLRLLSMIIKEKTPYEVTTTNNPLEALELAKKGSFDLLVADLKMPGLNGIELLESVKRFDEDIPTIIITAYGTVDFITKPFRKEQILFTIERALKWVRVQKENKMLREQLKKQ